MGSTSTQAKIGVEHILHVCFMYKNYNARHIPPSTYDGVHNPSLR